MKKAADAIPNQQLVEERLKRHWSQQEVADKVGTTAVNVSRWERGMSSPGAHFRYQLCTLFEKSAEALGLASRVRGESGATSQTAQQQSACAVPLEVQVLWNIPYRRNPFFTGREAMLKRLHDALHSEKAISALPCAISGLGGIGKTQTALEYAYRYRDAYHAILWARADTRENLCSDFRAIAEMLHLLDADEQDQTHAVETVKCWLHNHSNWLLILDNVEDLKMIGDFLPLAHNGYILLTTHTQIMGTLAQQVDLGKMELKEGVLFLLRRSKLIALSDQLESAPEPFRRDAEEISRLMDGLPLALDQAGAYIEETKCAFSDYLERYRLRRADLLNARGEFVTEHPASTSVTFSLSIECIEWANAIAANLLRLCAFLHPDAIPEEILVEYISQTSSISESTVDCALPFDSAIRELRKFSLLQRNPDTKTFTVHRLVQAVLRDRMDEQAQRCWTERAIQLVNRVFPNGAFATWQRCQQFLPQVQVCSTLIAQWGLAFSEAAQLLQQAGRYVYEQAASYAQAESFFRQSLALYQQILGPEHLNGAQCLTYLGRMLNEQGQYIQAENLLRHALAIQERALGVEHPDVAQSLIYLAIFYMDQGKYEQAEPLFQRSLCIWKRESNYPQLAQHLNTLACVYYYQGQYTQAESLFQQVLKMHEQVLEAGHPEIAESLFNVGYSCIAQEKYAQAQPFFRKALALYEQALEAGHPMIGLALNTLAQVHYYQGQYEQAEPLFQCALSIREQALGPKSPCVAESLSNLADLYRAQGKFSEAEYYHQRSLAVHESADCAEK